MKKSIVFKSIGIFWIAFFAILFCYHHPKSINASTVRNDVNSYFYPDGQKHSTVNVDVTIVANTTVPGGFIDLKYQWWYSNPNGDDYPLTDEEGNIITITVPSALGKSVVKFSASNFDDRGKLPVAMAGNYYIKVISKTQNGINESVSLLYNLRKDTTGKVEIIEITEGNPTGNLGYVWVKINYAGMYTGNNSTISSKVYKIGEEGEWQKYEGQFKVTKNSTIYAEYTDGIRTLSSQFKITSIDSSPPIVDISYLDDDYENPVVTIDEETSGLASVKYGWVKYNKVNNEFIIDEDAITLWRYANVIGNPSGTSIFNIDIDKLNDVQGDGYYKLHVIAKDRVGNESEEVISSHEVIVDFTGPLISFDDNGISQPQSAYEIILNVDENDLGLDEEGKKQLYFFMLRDYEVPFEKDGNGEPIENATDYDPLLLKNLYSEMDSSWVYRDSVTNKIKIKLTPEYFGFDSSGEFNENIVLYIKAVDEFGNITLASTEKAYHTTYSLPKAGELFVNATNNVWPFKIPYAQIVCVPDFSETVKEVFNDAGQTIDYNNLQVYYTVNYGSNSEDITAFNSLFDNFGTYRKLKGYVANDETWMMSGNWQHSSTYHGGYIGDAIPREIKITENTNGKVVRVMILDKTNGLCEIYDSYLRDNINTSLSFENIDNVAPQIILTSNWISKEIGKSVAVEFEINDNYGFAVTTVVQYQWTNFDDKANPDVLEQLNGNWLSITPRRLTSNKPVKLIPSSSIIKTVGDGKNYLWVRSVDSVGNVALYCKEFIVDTTAPVIDLRVVDTYGVGSNGYLGPEYYDMLLEPERNNEHVNMELRISDDAPYPELRLAQVLYRWVPDQYTDDSISWSSVSPADLIFLSSEGVITDEINYVTMTGYYRLQVRAVDVAGNQTEIVSSPPFYIINRAPQEPSLKPILVYDEEAEVGVIEVEISTTDPTVDDLFKYINTQNGNPSKYYNSISKPTYEKSGIDQYLKAVSVNLIFEESKTYSLLTIKDKWFIVPKVEITNMGSTIPINLSMLKNELVNIKNNKYNHDIITSYTNTINVFDKVEFALTSNDVTLDNMETSNITWLSDFTNNDIDQLISSNGTYRLWVRVYNQYPVTPTIGEIEYEPLAIAYAYTDYNVDITAPVVSVTNQELVYADDYINLLDSTFVQFDDEISELDITINVNGSIISGTNISQDAGQYLVVYTVSDQAGNTTVSEVLTINVKNIITLQGSSTSQTIYSLLGENIDLSNYTPDVPTGKVFGGWYQDINYQDKVENLIVGTKPQTVYAKYVDATNIITFNSNGGSGEMNDQVVSYNEEANLIPNQFIKTGYSFVGWSTEANGIVRYNDFASYAYNENNTSITLYAIWKLSQPVIELGDNISKTFDGQVISYNAEQPKISGINYSYQWYKDGVLLSNNSILEVIDVIDTGLYKLIAIANDGYEIAQTQDEISITINPKEVSIEWNGLTDYLYNGVDQSNAVSASYTNVNNQKIYLPIDFKYNNQSSLFINAGNYTLSVTNENSNYLISNNIKSVNILVKLRLFISGELVDEIGFKIGDSNLPALSKDGYTFYGWYDNIYYEGLEVKATSIIENSIDLYGYYEANTYYVVFDALGGVDSSGNESISELLVYYDSPYAKGSLPVVLKPGYTFMGWYTEPNGKGQKIEAQNIVKITKNILLYASWIAASNGVNSDFEYQTTNNGIVITKYIGASSSVVVPSKINNITVIRIDDRTFYGNQNITDVFIPGTVDEIGEYAFSNCKNLTSITLSEGIRIIGNRAFMYCSGLTQISIPASVEKLGSEYYSFVYADGLEEINVHPNNKVYSSIDGVLFNKEQTVLIKFPSSHKNADGSLTTSYMIPEGVTTLNNYSFLSSLLSEVTFPSTIRNIYSCAFERCSKLKTILIPPTLTSSDTITFSSSVEEVLTVEGAQYTYFPSFSYLSNLTSLTIPNGVKYWGGLYNCNNITDLIIPEGVKTITSIYNNAKLANVVIPSSVTSIGRLEGTLWYENLVKDAIANSGSTGTAIYINNILYAYVGTMPVNTDFVVREGTITIQASAFENATGLRSIVIPSSVKFIGDKAFKGCTNLQSVTFNGNVEEIGANAFEGCTTLQNVSLPNSVKTIGSSMFKDCTSLVNVTLPNAIDTLPSSLFEGCISLNNVTIPNTVNFIGSQAFLGCNLLQNIVIPSNVKVISNEVFSNIKTIKFEGATPPMVTSLTFKNCTSISTIYIPKGYGSSYNDIINKVKVYCPSAVIIEQ